jgi:hypothetical protein
LWTLPVLSPDARTPRPDYSQLALVSLNYAITRFVVRLNVFLSEPPAKVLEGQAWHRLELLDFLPMPSPHRRAVRIALQKSGPFSP